MKSFDKEITQFLVDGTFNNNLDDVGNINLSIDPIDVNERYIELHFKIIYIIMNKLRCYMMWK